MKTISTPEPFKESIKVEVIHESPERQEDVVAAHDKIEDNKGPYANDSDRY
jgi:hypothetical protein